MNIALTWSLRLNGLDGCGWMKHVAQRRRPEAGGTKPDRHRRARWIRVLMPHSGTACRAPTENLSEHDSRFIHCDGTQSVGGRTSASRTRGTSKEEIALG
jgi:hypothetical protein